MNEARLTELISDLRSRVTNLESRAFRVPVLSADPVEADSTNLWMLQDGRLRGRKPDGTVVEYAYSNHSHPSVTATPSGGSASTVVVTPTAVPTSRLWERAAAWSRSFNQGGSGVRSTTNLYYGNAGDSFNGLQKSMVGFDTSAQTEIGGYYSIDKVEIMLSNLHTYPNNGTDLKISLHAQSAAPSSYSETHDVAATVRVGKPSPNVWYQVPNWIGELLAAGTIRGFGLDQNSSDRNLYGYAQGGDSPRMRVHYSKV